MCMKDNQILVLNLIFKFNLGRTFDNILDMLLLWRGKNIDFY